MALMSYHTQRSCGHEWDGKRGGFPVPAFLTYCIVPPLGPWAHISRSWGGPIFLPLLVYTLNVSFDNVYYLYLYIFTFFEDIYIYVYIHIYIYIHLFICKLFAFCTSNSLHIKIWDDSSWKVCDPCRRDKMNPSGNASLGTTFDSSI